MIFAIDFDGTLCDNKYPDIGEPNIPLIEKCKKLQKEGHTIILWTCRHGVLLQKAVEWCQSQGLTFDEINTSTTDYFEKYGGSSGKVGADYYVDDRSVSPEEFLKTCYHIL